jgi:hypothetical protein
MGSARWITGDLIDTSADGTAVLLTTLLPVGSKVRVRGKFGESQTDEERQGEVRWYLEERNGFFRTGIEFLDGGPASHKALRPEAEADPEELDCYEVLQLSPNADRETIDRVYRLLAQRYHPDNSHTGNAEMFLKITQAFRILSDPEQRARYDVRHREIKQLKSTIFDPAHMASGPSVEQRKREGILNLLYAKVVRDPDHSTMNLFDFEDLLGCPREHLQAALWYLKGKGFIQRTDNGRFSITVQGFDEVERKPHSPDGAPRKLLSPATEPPPQ